MAFLRYSFVPKNHGNLTNYFHGFSVGYFAFRLARRRGLGLHYCYHYGQQCRLTTPFQVDSERRKYSTCVLAMR